MARPADPALLAAREMVRHLIRTRVAARLPAWDDPKAPPVTQGLRPSRMSFEQCLDWALALHQCPRKA